MLFLFRYVDDLGMMGERSSEFNSLFRSLLVEDHWKYYLALRGFLPHLGDLINKVNLVPPKKRLQSSSESG